MEKVIIKCIICTTEQSSQRNEWGDDCWQTTILLPYYKSLLKSLNNFIKNY